MADQSKKIMLKVFGILFMVGGMFLMFGRFFFFDIDNFTFTYVAILGAVVLMVIGSIMLKQSKRITIRTEHSAPVVWKDESVSVGKRPEKAPPPPKPRKTPPPPKPEKAPKSKYERSKMSKFLIDPEDMKKKK
jgi:hypothetical protein